MVKTVRSAEGLHGEVLHALQELTGSGGQPGQHEIVGGGGRFRPPGWSGVPVLPERFTDRPDHLERVRAGLCADRDGRTAVVGLVGMADAGKSLLARAVVADPAVRARFPDGAVWLNVGPQPDLVGCLSQVAEACGDLRPVTEVPAGRRRLARLLAQASVLVVADDVWSAEDAEALTVEAGRCGLLLTSRDEASVGHGQSVPVGMLDQQQARRLLAAQVGGDADRLPPEVDAVIEECGGLALAVAVAGGVAEGRRWSSVLTRLRRADLGRLQHRFPGYPHPDLLRALDVSVSVLPAEHQTRFRELAVFEGAGRVPVDAVAWLWRITGGVDELDSEDLLIELGRRSLTQHDVATGTVTLHDLLFDYIRTDLGVDAVQALHTRLAESYLDHWGGLANGLPGLRQLDDRDRAQRYGLAHTVSHLRAAGSTSTIHQLLVVQHPAGEHVENAWYAAQEQVGDAAAYLTDVREAWRLAEQATDTALERGQPAASIALELRYALIVASLVSIAANIPAPLLSALVHARLWLPAQALAYARAIPSTTSRYEALSTLAAHLSAEQRGPVLAEALAAARAIGDPSGQAEALGALAAHLPADLLAEALAAARAIGDPSGQAEALSALAPQLPAEQREPVLAEALAAARAIGDPSEQAEALSALGRVYEQVAGTGWSGFWRQAVSAASGVGRPVLLSVLASASSAVWRSGGAVAVGNAASAAIDVARWWP
jgi:NB-ARC domain